MSHPLIPAEFALVDEIRRMVFSQRRVEVHAKSTIAKALFNGVLRIRCLGAGGASPGSQAPGKGGTVGIRTVRVRKNDQFTLTIGGGIHSGGQSSITTVTGPNVNISIPAGDGAPSGLDWYRLAENAFPNLLWGMQQPPRFITDNSLGGGFMSVFNRFTPDECVLGISLPAFVAKADRVTQGYVPTNHAYHCRPVGFVVYKGYGEEGLGVGAYSCGSNYSSSSGGALIVLEWLEGNPL